MTVYTIGGGEIIYNIMQAVALCLNGGSGLLEALLRIGGLCGAFIAYYIILYGSPWEIIKSWGLPVLLIMNLLFVPSTTVKVEDTITRNFYKVDNVPYGLAVFASATSQLGKAITEVIEQNFSLPDDLTYQKTGMLFGSNILEKAKTFKITNRNFKENMRNFVGQCVKYDIMLNHKYTFDDLVSTNDIWGLVSSDPSGIRGFFWQPEGGGKAQYVTCKKAIEKFDKLWAKEFDRSLSMLGRKFFSTVGLQMDPAVERALQGEIGQYLTNTATYFGVIASNAEDTLKQTLMINAISDAASENSKQAGNPLTYAETRALLQQNSTFETVGKLASKLLPIMKAVIEALAYACFIFIIPLCMVPQGYKFLFNWLKVLVWLQAWPPMYAILNFIMNIAARSATLAEIGTAGGLTIGNYIGVSEANREIQLMAGYLAMSIPFICIAIVRGVGTFVHLSAQMTGASMQVAGAAASEVSTGNISLGNVSLRNHSSDNISQLQRNFNSSLGIGGHTVDTGTVMIRNDAVEGRSTITRGVSSTAVSISHSEQDTEQYLHGYQTNKREVFQKGMKLANVRQAISSETASFAKSISKMDAQTVASTFNLGMDKATQISQNARMLDSYYKGEAFHDQTQTSGSLSLSGNAGVNGGKSAKIDGSDGKSKLISFSAGGQIGGSLSGSVSVSNADNTGSTKQFNSSEDIAETQRKFENNIREIANSNQENALTQQAQNIVKMIQQTKSLSKEIAWNESQAQSNLESFNNSKSHSYIEQSNFLDSVLQVAKEDGFDRRTASRMIENRDQKSEAWKKEARSRLTVRPTQMIKQPTPSHWKQAETQLQNSFNKSEQKMRNEMKADSAKIDAKKSSLQAQNKSAEEARTSAINSTRDEIEFVGDQIAKNSDSLKNDVAERASKGTISSAKDKFLRTFFK